MEDTIREWTLPAGSRVKINGLPFALRDEAVVRGSHSPDDFPVGEMSPNAPDQPPATENVIQPAGPNCRSVASDGSPGMPPGGTEGGPPVLLPWEFDPAKHPYSAPANATPELAETITAVAKALPEQLALRGISGMEVSGVDVDVKAGDLGGARIRLSRRVA